VAIYLVAVYCRYGVGYYNITQLARCKAPRIERQSWNAASTNEHLSSICVQSASTAACPVNGQSVVTQQ